jgi:hypothetical protein
MKCAEDASDKFMEDMEKKVMQDDKEKGRDSLKNIVKHREGMSKRKTVVASQEFEMTEVAQTPDSQQLFFSCSYLLYV